MSNRILIIEDDEMVQAFMALHLENEGYLTLKAGTGGDGLQLLGAEAVDLVLLDLNLPDGDGLTVAQRIREVSAVPIIILTARTGQDDRLMALGLGADEYLTKPIDPQELHLRVRNMLARSGHPAPPPAAGKTPATPVARSAAVDAAAKDEIQHRVEDMQAAADQAAAKRRSPAKAVAVSLTLVAIAGGGLWWLVGRGPAVVPVAIAPAVPPAVTSRDDDAPRLPEVEDDARLAATSYSWVLRSKCGKIPYVSWWRVRTHADVVSYVNRRYAGDWKPYIGEWTTRLIELRDSYSKSRGVRTPDGDVITGVVLKAHIEQTQARLDVMLCLSNEAAEYSYQKNQPIR